MHRVELKDLIGTWKLIAFHVLDEANQIIPMDSSYHGHLIYTPDSYVSANINRQVNGERKDSLYTAKVEFVEAGHLRHHVLDASIISLINTTFDRYGILENKQLVLKDQGPSGKLKIIWKKIS